LVRGPGGRLQALLDEASRLGDAIAERHAAAERFVAVAGTLVGVGLTLGLFQDQPSVLVGLPLAVVIMVLYMIQIYTDAGLHSGHRQAIEERINGNFDPPLLLGQSVIGAKHARRLSVQLTFGLVALIWVGTVALGVRAVLGLWSAGAGRTWSLLVYFVLIAVALLVVARAVWENANAEKNARETATEKWSAS
jgi:hypothetical protein